MSNPERIGYIMGQWTGTLLIYGFWALLATLVIGAMVLLGIAFVRLAHQHADRHHHVDGGRP